MTLQNGVSAYPIKTTLTQSGKPAVADRLLIRFQAGVSDADQATIHKKAASLGAGAARSLTRISANGYLVDVSGAASLEAAAQAYKTADARVVSAAADGLANAPAAPPDGTIGTQWHLAKIHAPDAWTFTHGAAWATIAMLDTGDDPNHPDVSPRVVGRVNVLNGSQTSDDVLAFGTLAAGVAGAIVDNGFGVDGVSYSSQLLNVKIYDDASGNALRSICLQAPTRLHASGITPTSITLAWDDNTAAEDHFEMQYKLTSDNTINSWTSVTLAANTTSWQHDGLTPGISYDHRIRACDVGSSICTDFSGLFTMVAGFKTLSVTVGGAGKVTSLPAGINCGQGFTACSMQYAPGTLVTLSATALDNPYKRIANELSAWGGDCSGDVPTCVVMMDTPRSASATFVRVTPDSL